VVPDPTRPPSRPPRERGYRPGRGLIPWALFLCASPLLADRLVTSDGRIIEVQKARKLPAGGYRLSFEHGEILCPEEFVASVEIEGDMSDYVPQNDDEKKKLEQGYVRYRGRWLSRPAYQAELARETEEHRARTAELSSHSQFHSGWEKETKHFRFKSNTSPEILEHYSDLMEAYYDLMDRRLGISPTPTLRKAKMQVNIYKSRAEFTELTRVSPGVAGFFDRTNQELQFYHDYADPDISNWVALHEGTHLLTYLIEPQSWPQIWVNEGVADYFGSAEIGTDKKGNLTISSGRMQIERVLTVQQAIKDGDYVPLEKLFLIDRNGFHAFEYAHAWSFIYFLNNTDYEKGFKKFFKDFYTIPKSVEYSYEAFPNVQGNAKVIPPAEVRRLLLSKLGVKDVPQLEKEWLGYIAGLEIDAPKARMKRGIKKLFEGDVEELDGALEDLQAAIDGGVRDPQAYWARGVMRFVRKGDQEGCINDLSQAVELAPLSANYRMTLGTMLAGMTLPLGSIRVLRDEHEALKGDEATIQAARENLGLACALAPENDLYRETFQDFMEAYESR